MMKSSRKYVGRFFLAALCLAAVSVAGVRFGWDWWINSQTFAFRRLAERGDRVIISRDGGFGGRATWVLQGAKARVFVRSLRFQGEITKGLMDGNGLYKVSVRDGADNIAGAAYAPGVGWHAGGVHDTWEWQSLSPAAQNYFDDIIADRPTHIERSKP